MYKNYTKRFILKNVVPPVHSYIWRTKTFRHHMINDSTDCSLTTSTRICDIDEMMKPLPMI